MAEERVAPRQSYAVALGIRKATPGCLTGKLDETAPRAKKTEVDPPVRSRFTRGGNACSKVSRFSPEFVRTCLELDKKVGMKKAAEMLKIPIDRLRMWRAASNPNRKGAWSIKAMVPVMRQAMRIYKGTSLAPRVCLRKAVEADGRAWSTCKMYLSYETIPCPPGFPLFRETEVQLRAEKLWFLATGEASRATQAPTGRAPLPPRLRRIRVREVKAVRMLPNQSRGLD